MKGEYTIMISPAYESFINEVCEGYNLNTAKLGTKSEEFKNFQKNYMKISKMIRNKEIPEAKKAIKEEIDKIYALKKIIDDSEEPKNIAQTILSYFTPILTSAPRAKYKDGCNVIYTDDMSKRTNSDVKKRLQEICNVMIQYYRDLYKSACDKANSKKANSILDKYKK